MTIEQTVEIPASRRLTLEIPEEVPVGRARVLIDTLNHKLNLLAFLGNFPDCETYINLVGDTIFPPGDHIP